MSVQEVVSQVIEFDVSHVVITGGEPMLPAEIVNVCAGLRKQNSEIHITIETAGTIDRELECDLISISPKLSNSTPVGSQLSSIDTPDSPGEEVEFQQPFASADWVERHEATRMRPKIVQQLMNRYPYQLKFVVGSADDIPEIKEYLAMLKQFENRRVCLMPEGTDAVTLSEREAWLVPICDELGFTFCPRQHIHWYGNKRGT